MRVRAIDWLRGLVIMLMTVDHAGSIFDAAHMHGDSARSWVRGSPLPAGEFLTRWVTHLCAPTFVLLAGASLALSLDKRREQPGQTRFIVTRGLFIAALDPLWMSLGFARYQIVILQVLYAIGLSMVCMAMLRKLPTKALVGGAIVIAVFGELSTRFHPTAPALRVIWSMLFVAGPLGRNWVCGYPLVPWLSIMMLGWGLGRWLLSEQGAARRTRTMVFTGLSLLGGFVAVRAVDGYGNWGLHRDSANFLQWLHVAKYPPSLAFMTLELGIALVLLSLFLWLEERPVERPLLAPLALLGSTAFFYYLLHVHVMGLASLVLRWDDHHYGLAKTWGIAALTILALLGPTAWYRRYKSKHPDGLARYV